MHLVFHGVVTNIVEVAHQFITERNLGSEYIRIINLYMLDITTLWLDWCHMKLSQKRLLLMEGELGLARILSFIHGHFF